MPFYEYQCKNCGHELEAMQKVSDTPLKKCPHCGKAQLQRLMSAPVFRLKGGGWYETDFKDDKDKKRNLAERSDAAEAPKDSDAKSDAKPDVKADDKAGVKPDKSSAEPSTKSKEASDKTEKKSLPTDKPAHKKTKFARQRRGAAKPAAKPRQKRK